LKTLQRDLETARKTSAPDTTATFIPTQLRLQFNTAGEKPVEINSTNVKWSWNALTQRIGKYCLDTAFGKQCFATQPRGDKDDVDQKIVILLLVFDKPIVYKEIKVNLNGASFSWSQIDKSEKFAVVSVGPDPAKFVLEVNMTP
jgi:hypothetical protein